MSSEKNNMIIELKKAYVEELLTLHNYLSIGTYLEGVDGEHIGEELIQDVAEERNHAERLAQRIAELDDRPPLTTSVGDLSEVGQDVVKNVKDEGSVEEAVRAVIDLEEGAIERYKRIIKYSRELNDPTTRRLCEDLLADEEAHLDEFEGYLDQMF